MEISNEMKQELLSELELIFPNQLNYKIDNFQRLHGADTETIGFRFIMEEKALELILRLYRGITDRVETEFKTLDSLYKAGLSVPKTYLWRKKAKTVSRSYLIMEKIPGMLLSDYLFQNISDQEKLEKCHLFIQEMANIHNFDWSNYFTETKSIDLDEDPYLYVTQEIKFPKEMINKFNIGELKPLIGWLEKKKEKSEKLSLLHGDYHMNNVIITPEKKLVVIDWANMRLGDFRHDLGFSIVSTSSAGEDFTKPFTDLYQTIAGVKVKNIEYYMILSNLHNFLRIYSALTNPKITNETEITKNMFMNTYRNYTQYLVKIVRTVTGIQLSTLEKALT